MNNNYNSGIKVPGENITLLVNSLIDSYLRKDMRAIVRKLKISKILLQIKNPLI
jgi:hypothetical protein